MKLSDPIKLPEVNVRTFLGVAAGLLGILDIVLLVKLGLAIFSAHSVSAQEMQARQLQLKAQDMEVEPMRGLDTKLAMSDREAADFYATRLPDEWSSVLAELGRIAHDNGVALSRVGYAPKAAGSGLTQVRLDSTLTGDYQPLMKFINAMERDKLFFVVRGIGLSGQQGGIVNLRLSADTYLRAVSPEELAAQAAADPANAPETTDAVGTTQTPATATPGNGGQPQ